MLRPLRRSLPKRARQTLRNHVPVTLWRAAEAAKDGDTAAQRWLASRLHIRDRDGLAPAIAGSIVDLVMRGAPSWAHPVTEFRTDHVLAAHCRMVADALSLASVPFVVLPETINQRRVVVISADFRVEAMAAVAMAARGNAIYACEVDDEGPTDPSLITEGWSGATPEVVRVFRVLCSPDGRLIGGRELACEIQFWSESTADARATPGHDCPAVGSLSAPQAVRNAWVDEIPAAERDDVVSDDEGLPQLAGLRHPHVMTFSEPIDVVYTWVDGSCPAWQDDKSRALRTLGRDVRLHSLASNPSRFISRDELRYSLRSLEMYADWVRHVYLVTAGQVPAWLDTSNPRITLVDHRDLFGDRGRLPTFNSHAIETQLHHIDGLSEHFLYLNDDVFFGTAVTPTHFFHSNGMSKFFQSRAKIGLGPSTLADTPVVSAAKNNRDLLERFAGVTITQRMQHVPHPLRRSVLFDLEREFADAVGRTASTQFRSRDDVSVASSLAHYYAYLTGRGVPGELSYFYADIARDETAVRLDKLLRRRNKEVFCLNDIDSSAGAEGAQLQRLVNDFLDAYFPLPSSFEKDVR